MTLRIRFSQLPFLGLALTTLVACGGANESGAPGDDTSRVEEPIINGTDQPAGAAEGAGFFMTTDETGNCSLELLTNDWGITARHCADGSVTLRQGSSTISSSNLFLHPTLDVALVSWRRFIPAGAGPTRFDFTRYIYPGTNASLNGQLLLCEGYGANSISPCPEGSGGGTLRFGNIHVKSTTPTTLVMDRSSLFNQIQAHGDSGGTCLVNEMITGILSGPGPGGSTGACSGVDVLLTGPEGYRSWALGIMAGRPPATMHTATSSTIAYNFTRITDSSLNSGTLIHATANWNGNGTGGVYDNANTGVWFDTNTSKWTVFNENGTAMPNGAKFNYWKAPPGSIQHVATTTSGGCNTLSPSCNIPSWLPHVSQLNLGSSSLNGNPNLIIVVTQLFASQNGVYNDRAVGVWFDAPTAHWYVFNEDGSAMIPGARFVVSQFSSDFDAFGHLSGTSTVGGNSTQLSSVNLNGQPNAQMIVTHQFVTGDAAFHNHPLGVWYDTSTSKWKIFNQDGAPMPTGRSFNVIVRP